MKINIIALPDPSLTGILTSNYKADLIEWLNTHPEAFQGVVELSLTNRQPVSWRAAWLLWSCMEDNDVRVQPFVGDIISTLACRSQEQQREFLIILRKMETEGEQEGLLFDVSAGIWSNTAKKPAVRMNALRLLVKIAMRHPALLPELNMITQAHYLEKLSPAAIKSVSKLLRKAIGPGGV